jgi:hypothetical protein
METPVKLDKEIEADKNCEDSFESIFKQQASGMLPHQAARLD